MESEGWCSQGVCENSSLNIYIYILDLFWFIVFFVMVKLYA